MSGPGEPPPPLRWTRLTYLSVGAGTALLLAGVVLHASTPVFVGLPFLIAPLAAAVTGPRRALRADLAWRAGGQEGTVTIDGLIRGDRAGALADLDLTFDRPGNLEEERPPQFGRSADGVVFRLHWRAPFPTLAVVEPPTIVWRDPVGFVERPTEGVRAALVIDRFPPELVRLGAVKLDRVLALPGETRSRRLGAAGEFFGMRDAEPTDPPRRINWRATARLGRPVANDYELDRTGDVLLLIDRRPSRLGRGADEVLLGAARAAALGLADAFARQKARVGLATFGEFVEPVPLAGGRAQRLRLREAIRAVRGATVFGPSERCAATLPRFFSPGITTILISSLTGDADADLVAFLRRRGYPTIVLSPSPGPLLPLDPRLGPAEIAIARRIERLGRRQRLARVWRHAPVVDWDDLWSLSPFVALLHGAVRRRAH